MSDETSNPWRCAVCGQDYVIQPLARDCEKRHEREAEGEA